MSAVAVLRVAFELRDGARVAVGPSTTVYLAELVTAQPTDQRQTRSCLPAISESNTGVRNQSARPLAQ